MGSTALVTSSDRHPAPALLRRIAGAVTPQAMRHRVRATVALAAAFVLAAIPLRGGTPAQPAAGRAIVLATTTSTQDSGLLDVLVPRFEKERGIPVKVIAVGTGAALRMAARGDADVVLVHSPEAERPHVDAGDLIEGRGRRPGRQQDRRSRSRCA